ncbi:hypothetical protein A3H09_02830 [Candidatus Falkowbacteria bacterium RIFCSPLOWO2_12_FULL_45_13]|uniref:Uncharacterized protein n=2 Tax=Candidatus Falkowiibacteriota TaxID=1752728 RepID=A0A1F5SCT9_9BACT|nr:MAG: hypothetical protein A3H66_01980 [Candidatus Falkowbacteria bacterium RIFCSPLOWO2_02_FULL_45_21]OGF29880.1 MAG: hypothetical protein A3H09_02830 [Candidatus Falkowbacteria bacterium RIFCSPLOWO2_12_FULL_45_13]
MNNAITKGRIRMLVQSMVAESRGWLITNVNDSTELKKGEADQLFGQIAVRIGRPIPKRFAPRHGWKVSTIVGYTYEYLQGEGE